MLLRLDVFFFSCQKIIRKQLLLHVFESQSCYGVCEALACDTLLTEEEDSFLYNIKYFFFICKYFVQISALSYFLAPAAADVDAVSVGVVLYCMERTFSYAASAVVAVAVVDQWLQSLSLIVIFPSTSFATLMGQLFSI